MLATKPRLLLSSPLVEVTRTGIDAEALMTRDDGRRGLARQAAWQKLIDRKLMDWLRDPSQLEDEGIEAPSGTILRLSIDLAEQFRDNALLPPDSVVPDPNGGIVFERREGDVSEVFHVWEDGTVEYRRFHGTRLDERGTL